MKQKRRHELLFIEGTKLNAIEMEAGWHFCPKYDFHLCQVKKLPKCDCEKLNPAELANPDNFLDE